MPRAVISKQFWDLQPKKPEEVREIWLIVHIICLCITACTGWLAAFSFGTYLENFDFHCVLFGKLLVLAHQHPGQRNLTIYSNVSLWDEVLRRSEGDEIDIKRSKWGDIKLCYFVQFIHVASMLSSIIWIVFFAISGSGSRIRGPQIIGKPYRLVLPFFAWCILSIVLIFASSSTLTGGMVQFCVELDGPHGKIQDTKICFGSFVESYKIFFGDDEGRKLYVLFVLTKLAGYAEIGAWIINALWTCLRIYLIIDYKFYLVTVWRYEASAKDRPIKTVSFVQPDK